MSLATLINKFISNHAKILLKEMKNRSPMTIHSSVSQHPISLLYLFNKHLQWLLAMNVLKYMQNTITGS